jgi:hypothetical protein
VSNCQKLILDGLILQIPISDCRDPGSYTVPPGLVPNIPSQLHVRSPCIYSNSDSCVNTAIAFVIMSLTGPSGKGVCRAENWEQVTPNDASNNGWGHWSFKLVAVL